MSVEIENTNKYEEDLNMVVSSNALLKNEGDVELVLQDEAELGSNFDIDNDSINALDISCIQSI